MANKANKNKKNNKSSLWLIFVVVLCISFCKTLKTDKEVSSGNFLSNVIETVQSFFKETQDSAKPSEEQSDKVSSSEKQTGKKQSSKTLPEKKQTDKALKNNGKASSSVYNRLEIPISSGSGPDYEIHEYEGFTLCYRESYEQSEWVAYEITKDELKKEADRSNNFREDPSISTKSATPGDYTKSGYDRGHLAPAADMAFSEKAMSESFFMSNMSPQRPNLNRGIWNHLEQQTRDWARHFGSLYVVSGPVLEKKNYKTIGKNNVAVPEYFYKILLAQTDEGFYSIAFIIPNADSFKDDYFYYAVTIDEIEERTGIDFFPQLEDDIEDQLESTKDISIWSSLK